MMSIFSGIPSSRLGYQVVLHLICWLTQSPWDDIPYSVDPQGGENHDVSWEFHGLLKVFPHKKKGTTSWTWNFRGFPTVDFTEKKQWIPQHHPSTFPFHLWSTGVTCRAGACSGQRSCSFIFPMEIPFWGLYWPQTYLFGSNCFCLFGFGNVFCQKFLGMEMRKLESVKWTPFHVYIYIYVCGVLKAFWDGKRIHIL